MKKIVLIFLFGIGLIDANAQCPSEANYLLNGNGQDVSGNNYHGVIVNSVPSVQDRHGNSSGAMHFDGAANYIDLPSDFDYAQRTVNVWFKADTITTLQATIYDSDHPGMINASTKIYTWTVNNIPSLCMSMGNSGLAFHSEPINLHQWYMATIVIGSSDVKFYLDGQLINTLNLNPGVAVAGHSTALIGSTRLIDRFFKGSIDDVSIYDCALSQSNIDALFGNQCTIEANYLLDGNGQDASGNNYHGVIVNTVPSVQDRHGNSSGAMHFDGTANYIDLPSDFDFVERSVNVWFKADTITTLQATIYDSDHPAMINSSTKIYTWVVNSVPSLCMSMGNSGLAFHSEPINLHQWYMATIVIGSSDVKFYLNGQLINTLNLNPGVAVAGHSTALIGSTRLIDRFFKGSIDDVSIYDCAISQNTIDSLFGNFSSVNENSLAEMQLNIYPNPTENNITIDLPAHHKNINYEIFDAVGKLINTSKLFSNTINVSDLSSGIYFLNIDVDGVLYKQKFIKN